MRLSPAEAHGPAAGGGAGPELALQLLAVQPRLGGLLLAGGPGAGKSAWLRRAAECLCRLGAPGLLQVPAGCQPEEAAALAARIPRGGVVLADSWTSLAPGARSLLARTVEAQGGVLLVAVPPVPADVQAEEEMGGGRPGNGFGTWSGPDGCGLWLQLPDRPGPAERYRVLREGELPVRPDADTLAALQVARQRLPEVELPGWALDRLARWSAGAGIASLRADWLAAQAALAAAALAGRRTVGEADLQLAWQLVLAPRSLWSRPARQRAGQPGHGQQAGAPRQPSARGDGAGEGGGTQSVTARPGPARPGQARRAAGEAGPPSGQASDPPAVSPSGRRGGDDGWRRTWAPSPVAVPPLLAALWNELARAGALRASQALAGTGGGPGVSGRPWSWLGRHHSCAPPGRPAAALKPRGRGGRPAVLATLRAALPWQRLRGWSPGRPLRLRPEDLRVRRYSRCPRELVLVLADGSGSMADSPIRRAKGAVRSLLLAAYRRRAEVALIACGGGAPESPGGGAARLLTMPGRQPAGAARLLAAYPVGGPTPLAQGLALAAQVAARARRRAPCHIVLVAVTDGRANQPRQATPPGWSPQTWIESELAALGRQLQQLGVVSVVLDPRPPHLQRGEGQRLARQLGGWWLPVGSYRPRPSGSGAGPSPGWEFTSGRAAGGRPGSAPDPASAGPAVTGSPASWR